jgi:hypothetical protein
LRVSKSSIGDDAKELGIRSIRGIDDNAEPVGQTQGRNTKLENSTERNGESRQLVTLGRSMGCEGLDTDDERSRGRGRRGEEEAGEK